MPSVHHTSDGLKGISPKTCKYNMKYTWMDLKSDGRNGCFVRRLNQLDAEVQIRQALNNAAGKKAGKFNAIKTKLKVK